MFGSFGMILGVLVVAVVGVGTLVFLRKKKSADEGALTLAEHAGPNGLKRGEIRMTYTEKKKTAKPAEAEPAAPKARETVIQSKPAPVFRPSGLLVRSPSKSVAIC